MTRENKEAAKHISMELTADGARVTSLSLAGNRLYLTIEAELSESQLKATDADGEAAPRPAQPQVAAKNEEKPRPSSTTSFLDRENRIRDREKKSAKSGNHLGITPEPEPDAGQIDHLSLLSRGSESLPPAAAAFTPTPEPEKPAHRHSAADPVAERPGKVPSPAEAVPPPIGLAPVHAVEGKADSGSGSFRYQEPQKSIITIGASDASLPPLPKAAPISLEPLAAHAAGNPPATKPMIGHFDTTSDLNPADTQPIMFKPVQIEEDDLSAPLAQPFEPVRELTETWDDTRSIRHASGKIDTLEAKEETQQLVPPRFPEFDATPEISLDTGTEEGLAVPGLSLEKKSAAPVSAPPIKEVRLGDLALDDDPAAGWKTPAPALGAASKGEPKPVTETWEGSDFGFAAPPKEPEAAAEESNAVGGARHGEPQPSISFGLDSSWTPSPVSPPLSPMPTPPAPTLPAQAAAWSKPAGTAAPALSLGGPAHASPAPSRGLTATEPIAATPPSFGLSLDKPAPAAPAPGQAPSLSIGGVAASEKPGGEVTLGGGKWDAAPAPTLGPAPVRNDNVLTPPAPSLPPVQFTPPAPPPPPAASKWDAPDPAPTPTPAAPSVSKWDSSGAAAPLPQAAAPMPVPEKAAPSPAPDGRKMESVRTEPPKPEPEAEDQKDRTEGGGTTVLIRYTCPKCKTQGMQAVDKVGTVVNCSNCGKAMRLVMKK